LGSTGPLGSETLFASPRSNGLLGRCFTGFGSTSPVKMEREEVAGEEAHGEAAPPFVDALFGRTVTGCGARRVERGEPRCAARCSDDCGVFGVATLEGVSLVTLLAVESCEHRKPLFQFIATVHMNFQGY
jgi:hypothetical protein